MITAEIARSITNSNIANSNIANLRDLLPFKYAIEKVEKYVKEAASQGKRYFSYNVDALVWGGYRPTLEMRKAIAEELRKNGFSYTEIWKDNGCVWFEVSW